MPRLTRLVPFALVVGVVVFGCKQVPVEQAAPMLTSAAGSPVSADQLAAGRAVYVSAEKCARCHAPKPVADYSADKWVTSILPRMAPNCKLSDDDRAAVLAYVTAGAAMPTKVMAAGAQDRR